MVDRGLYWLVTRSAIVKAVWLLVVAGIVIAVPADLVSSQARAARLVAEKERQVSGQATAQAIQQTQIAVSARTATQVAVAAQTQQALAAATTAAAAPTATAAAEATTLAERQAAAAAVRATEVAGVFATQTEEARPTAVPVPPTVARQVTAVPAASAGLTAAEAEYRDQVIANSADMSKWLQNLTDQMQADDLLSDDWKIRTVVVVVAIQSDAKEALAWKAPARFKTMDSNYKAGMRHFNSAMDLLVQGIDKASTKILEQASTEMNAGADAMSKALTAMQALDK